MISLCCNFNNFSSSPFLLFPPRLIKSILQQDKFFDFVSYLFPPLNIFLIMFLSNSCFARNLHHSRGSYFNIPSLSHTATVFCRALLVWCFLFSVPSCCPTATPWVTTLLVCKTALTTQLSSSHAAFSSIFLRIALSESSSSSTIPFNSQKPFLMLLVSLSCGTSSASWIHLQLTCFVSFPMTTIP